MFEKHYSHTSKVAKVVELGKEGNFKDDAKTELVILNYRRHSKQ